MAAARFFIDAPLASDSQINLPTAVAHHATRALRLRDGAPITLFNGEGGEFAATLAIVGKSVRAVVGEHDPIERESSISISLIQSWIAADKLDWTIEKAVELGVTSIVLSPAQRSVIRVDADRAEKRMRRLREIAIAACAQSGRNRIPTVASTNSLTAALQTGLSGAAIGVLLHPPAQMSLLQAVPRNRRVTLAIGPEGGFDENEVDLAHRHGWQSCRLGPRVLRTETAGIAAIATLQAVNGDLLA